MNSRRWSPLALIIVLLCWEFVATDSQLTTTTVSGNHEETPSPAPGVENATADDVGTPAPNVTGGPTVVSEGTTVVSEAPSFPTAETAVTKVCLCDLTPGFCDIGCCCDTVDCEVANLSSVFTGCPKKSISGICIDKWLIFRANVDSSLVTVTDTLFCVQKAALDHEEFPPAPPRTPLPLGNSYHFSPPAATKPKHNRDFYQADDIIQTYSSNSSMKSFLHQPSPGAASSLCFNRNPAKFLRSVTLSCSRKITSQSCAADSNLDPRSYFTDLALLKIPVSEQTPPSDLLVPITALSDWAAPSEQNDMCVNVARKVELVIGYTSKGELTFATVNVVFADVQLNQLLLQDHTVQFQLVPQSPQPDIPSVGIQAGSPVIGRFDDAVTPLTTLGVSQGGECSSDSSTRSHVLFQHNTVTGCVFRSSGRNCSELRSQIHTILEGLASPGVIAMNSGSQPDWTRVIRQECPVSMQESCDSGCNLPRSLSLRVLWARQGPLDLPQNYILGAKYLFQCARMKCPLSTPLTLTSEVTFVDTTVFPDPPRGQPQFDWKFPFGFFTRGLAEIEGHLINGGHTQRVSWSLVTNAVVIIVAVL
ncbi:tectonic-3-like [Neosynchiropus ocellatus]